MDYVIHIINGGYMKTKIFIVALLGVVILNMPVYSQTKDKAIIGPNLVAEVDSNGNLVFYVSPTKIAAMRPDQTITSELGATRISTAMMMQITEKFFEEARETVCKMKYKPSNFGISIAGWISASWDSKDVCRK